MLTCDRLIDKYSEYFELALSLRERELFDMHLSGCPSCSADYEVFATMFRVLDKIDVDEVEVPSGFRSKILAEIARQPTPAARVLSVSWWQRLLEVPKTAWAGGFATATAAAILLTLVLHPGSHATGPLVSTGSMVGGSGSSSQATPLLQNVFLRSGVDGLDYDVYTLHTPGYIKSTANVSAYVLQNEAALTNEESVNDPDSTSPAWTGTLEPNVSLTLPVAVTSDLPPASTLDILFEWTPADGKWPEQREVVFDPVTPAASVQTPVAAGGTFYDDLKTVAGAYQVTIVADGSALTALASNPQLAGASGNEDNALEALHNVLGPAGFTVTLQPGGFYLVSH